jgi:hypothetical protein
MQIPRGIEMDKQTESVFIARVRKLMRVAQSFHGEERGDDAVSALACIALLLDELLPPRGPDDGERREGADVVDLSVYREALMA